MNELYLTWATCEAASVSALCHSGCSAPGAPPLEHVQLWQVISLHKIIIETWNFVCMIQTLVRLHSIFFKFFSLLKNCKKNIKTYFQLSDPSQSGLKKIRNKSLNFSYKISFWIIWPKMAKKHVFNFLDSIFFTIFKGDQVLKYWREYLLPKGGGVG